MSLDSLSRAVVRKFRSARTSLLSRVEKLGLVGWVMVFLLPCVVDAVWVALYFIERDDDVKRDGGPCFNDSGVPSAPEKTPRTPALFWTQAVFAVLSVGVWMPFRVLFAGSYKFRFTVYVNVLIDCVTALPFIVAIFFVPARDLFVPSFLRVWIARFSLSFVVSAHDLHGEAFLFAASALCVGVTMVAAFEFAQNNFPATDIAVGSSLEGSQYTCTSFLLATYWLIVTLSTVGYGDLTPANSLARLTAAVSIVIFIVLLPHFVGRIRGFLERSRDRRRTRYVSRPHQTHVVVHGHIDMQILAHALFYFNPVRRARKMMRGHNAGMGETVLHWMAKRDDEETGGRGAQKLVSEPANFVVLMSNHQISDGVLSHMDVRSYQRSFVSLFQGSLLTTQDQRRCSLHHAAAVLVLPQLEQSPPPPRVRESVNDVLAAARCSDARSVEIQAKVARLERTATARDRLFVRDYHTLLRAVSAHQTLHLDQLLVVVLFHEVNEKYLLDAEDAGVALGGPAHFGPDLKSRNLLMVSMDRLQQRILAASCLVPGISTLLFNCFNGEDHAGAFQGSAFSVDASVDAMNMETSIACEQGMEEDTDDEADLEAQGSTPRQTQSNDTNGCACTAASTHGVIEMYGWGLLQELEVMAVKEGNPFLGWRSFEVTATIYRDFGVVLLGVTDTARCESLLEHTADPAKLFKPHRDGSIEEGDYLVLLGKGQHLDRVFAVTADEYVDQDEAPGSAEPGSEAAPQRSSSSTSSTRSTRTRSMSMRDSLRGKAARVLGKRMGDTLPTSRHRAHVRLDVGLFDSPSESQSSPTKEPHGGNQVATATKAEAQAKAVAEAKAEAEAEAKAEAKAEAEAKKGAHEARTLEEAYLPDSSELFKQERPLDVLESHIILCSPAKSPIRSFMLTLRQGRTEIRPVVWLVSEPPGIEVWREVCHMRELYWLIGEPQEENDLVLAGIDKASDLVLMADYSDKYVAASHTNASTPMEPADVDRSIIQACRIVRKFTFLRGLSNLRLHTHLNYPENTQYLHHSLWRHHLGHNPTQTVQPHEARQLPGARPGDAAGASAFKRIWRRPSVPPPSPKQHGQAPDNHPLRELCHSLWPMILDETYAAGEVWSVCSFYFALFNSFASGEAALANTLLRGLTAMCGNHVRDGPSISLVPVPPRFYGKPYALLFSTFLQREGRVCLGLFRGIGHGFGCKSFPRPVVLTNPRKTLKVAACDHCYLLGYQQ